MPPWDDPRPVRSELFSIERLEQHAGALAATQAVAETPPRIRSLQSRLDENRAVLVAAYRSSAADLQRGRPLAPAAEWLLDNYQLVEAQIREARDNLPPGYYRVLPKLAAGPFAGYPRVFGIAWAFVAHTDSHFDPETLRRFLVAYQHTQPLTIGELWAVSITLRIVLIENLRRIADQIGTGQTTRAEADALADRLLAPRPDGTPSDPEAIIQSTAPLSERLVAQLAKRLRDQDPRTTPALGWLEHRLRRQGTSIDEAVQHAQQRQGASNVTVRNIITSLRLIAAIDWTDLFEDVSLVDARLRAGSAFETMDLPTRNLYRSAIEQLARGSSATELDVAARALQAAQDATSERAGDPGYHLIAEGRPALERSIGFKPAPRLRFTRFTIRLGIGGYAAAIFSTTAALLFTALALLAADGVGMGWLVLLAAIGFLPATDLAAALVNRAVISTFGATSLPGLDLLSGVPEALRTLVVIPTLLTSETEVLEQVAQLEVHFLSGAPGDMAFALLTDGIDAPQETHEQDAPLLAAVTAAIQELNRRHGPAPAGHRFLLLHRHRVFNASENVWMGWERKRGKLHELNRLLRGATDTSYIAIEGRPPEVPSGVRYVITLDSDTRLPRDAAARLIGKMGHPLNRPRFGQGTGELRRVVGGHAILQPRVTPLLSRRQDTSLFQRVSAGPGGMDPYSAAVSDVYQDLFSEGSYTGKGIYDVDAFEAALAGRIPDNALLSHDLFEGIFARAGLASDIEVVEEFPSRYEVAAGRLHRWTRGDWQLIRWVFGPGTRVPAVGRWKMFDNLRRSLHAPFTLLSLAVCWLLPSPADIQGVLLVLASVAIPACLPVLLAALPVQKGVRWRDHAAGLAADLGRAGSHIGFTFAFLPDQAWRMGDAIVRTLARVFLTRRNLLEWTTAAQTKGRRRLDVTGFYRLMAPGTLLGCGLAAAAMFHAPVAALFGLLWLAAPALAFWVSQPRQPPRRLALTEDEARSLRLTARRTWRFFETFVTPLDNMLPPDNFQEEPKPAVAHRTSPTNLGLYLLSTVAAHDFGWTGSVETVERLEAAFASMQRLPRFKGHFYNWYETTDLRLLEPAYVSAVDSGNLAGHLLVLANACETWTTVTDEQARLGLLDTLEMARDCAAASPDAPVTAALNDVEAQLRSAQSILALLPTLKRLSEKAALAAKDHASAVTSADLVFWTEAVQAAVTQHGRDRMEEAGFLTSRLQKLAATARSMATDMDFAFLIDRERKLLSIGYNVATNTLDHNCYDLLASEARLASLFAIAKGDVPTRHWFRLGRATTPVGSGSALISWAGSMFEYLMPALVMDERDGSLLGETNRLVVERQQDYARGLGTPWGISESAYNARDLEFTYQYSTFGIPGLGLKRGLADSRVIAPYATGLAAMVDPGGAQSNFARLAGLGGAGRYGFYEAMDFTPARLPEGESVAVVRNFMVHHQGMTIAAIANVLQDGRMRRRFHQEPMIQASELLLQDRVPRNVPFASLQIAEARALPAARSGVSAVRRVKAAFGGAPATHLLSNGRYAVMLTASGAGYSRWQDIAVTRWREDPTLDDWGSFVMLRDPVAERVWSAGAQPGGAGADHDEVLFAEDHAEFIRRDGSWTTTMDVLVSGEAEGEVRRVSVTNSARRTRQVELTSYAELVLATAATDNAHPAFAKMFVHTEFVPEYGALVATRRPRSTQEPVIWAAHFTVVEGQVAADPQYETDRARFLGRGRSITAAAALGGRPLTNTVGTVLDPVFALRQSVSVPPGQVARVAFWTLVASSREELLNLVDTHHDRRAFDRARTLAWTQAQVELRFLGIDGEEAADFQRLAAPILYADGRFRSPSDTILRGAGPQSRLWPHSISGDLPIVLLHIDDLDDMGQVRQLLQAHEYWRMRRLAVDLVIVNEHRSSYLQDLQVAIETAVRISQSGPRRVQDLVQGSIFTLRADLIGQEARLLLQSVARVVLTARRGPIQTVLGRIPKPQERAVPPAAPPAVPVGFRRAPVPADIEFFNGFGGFVQDGREYLTVLNDGRSTPAPWINVIANPDFGFQVSAEGSGYTWAENSRENQITPWSNDWVSDPACEAFYVQDVATGEVWSPTALPVRSGGVYSARHGHGYTRFEHNDRGIGLELLQYVPLADPIKISRLKVRNTSAEVRRLSVTAFAEWSLGRLRSASAAFITTTLDESKSILAQNPWNGAFPGRVAFADMAGRQTAWTADRTEFLGRGGSLAAPAALGPGKTLSGRTGAGLDPCVAQQCHIELAPGQVVEVVWFLGQCQSAAQAQALIARYRALDLDLVLAAVTEHWRGLLGAIQVKTPDRAMDIMLNGWLLYQTLACRIWARSAFYQSSGAYGFRDQLQDGMALTFAMPDLTRHHILRAAARQFIEGDVQHWWLPHSGQGVRTHISDDRVWLAFATASYIAASADAAILDEIVPFLDGPPLAPDAHDAFFQPDPANESASLFEHCARGLDQCLALTGVHGLPLMGGGDWNDGMNRVGEGGRGESVWLGWLLVRTIALFAPLAEARDPGRAARWRDHAARVCAALDGEAWDGAWFRRATFDDGTWLGSDASDECRIDSIAQSWAVLSDAADPARAKAAMAAVEQHLIRRNDQLALLFTPPFDKTRHDPGYIKGYPPGLRENGGQYSHAAMWAVFAFAKLGEGRKAADLFALLNPINHSSNPADTERYKVEPYVIAADVYSVAPHVGRGGWTWYTGSAGWMHRAGIEAILGIRRAGAQLIVDPRIPPEWPGFEATVAIGEARYAIVVTNSVPGSGAAAQVMLDGVALPTAPAESPLPLDGKAHTVSIQLQGGPAA